MTESARNYLIFTLAGSPYAFDLSQVAEVMEQPETWPIPLAPGCYPGAMNFHGEIVAVLDLAMFLGLPEGQASRKTVVLDTHLAALALRVETIIRITTPEQAILWESTDDGTAIGHLNLPEGKIILLDAVAIAERAAATING